MPDAGNIEKEEMHVAMMDNILEGPDRWFAWVEVPEYGETTRGPPIPEDEEKEHFIIVGCDPNGDEPAGVDGEWRYFKSTEHVVIDPFEVQKRKRARSDPEIRDFDTEVVPDDEATMLNDFIMPHTSHDQENPIIRVGNTFVDKNAFVHTIRQYAIRNEFDTRIEHSDKVSVRNMVPTLTSR
jgi:hypothetical protein